MNLVDANKLFLQGQIALAEIESNGIRINEPYLDRVIYAVKAKIRKYQDRMKKTPIWGAWQKRYKKEANLGSRPQLGKVLFEDIGIKYPVKEGTKTGRYKTSEDVLNKLDLQFVKDFIRVEKLKKVKSTYLVKLKEETINGFYHPDHHLNTVTTYRSSADGIQTIPTRNEWAKKAIRSCFVPRPGHVFIATDMSAHEFKVAASVWRDKEMMAYAADPTKDIHRDVAAKLFCCKKDQVTKELRYIGKNGFVFPRLYGSWYCNIAPNIWSGIEGKPFLEGTTKEWLATKGIVELGVCDPKTPPLQGTFEYRVREVEKWFDDKFSDFTRNSEEAYQKYRERGYFKHVTGFIQRGLYTKKDIKNHKVQGPAFHALMWVMIRLIREIKLRRMKTKLLAEIHDDILADVPEDEEQSYLNLVEFTVGDIQNHWKWIKVPLAMEAKMSAKNWATMQTVVKKEGKWQIS